MYLTLPSISARGGDQPVDLLSNTMSRVSNRMPDKDDIIVSSSRAIVQTQEDISFSSSSTPSDLWKEANGDYSDIR